MRKAVGPKIDVMLDFSAVTTPDVAVRLARRLAEYDIAFIEEPVDPFDEDALRFVHEKVDIPIAVGERLYTRYGFKRVLELHAADILQPDIGYVGGLMEAKKIAAMGEAYSMKMQPHLISESPVSTAVALQFDACITNFYIHEHYYRDPAHYELAEPVPDLDFADGYLPIPDRPGLGVALDHKVVDKFLWATVTG